MKRQKIILAGFLGKMNEEFIHYIQLNEDKYELMGCINPVDPHRRITPPYYIKDINIYPDIQSMLKGKCTIEKDDIITVVCFSSISQTWGAFLEMKKLKHLQFSLILGTTGMPDLLARCINSEIKQNNWIAIKSSNFSLWVLSIIANFIHYVHNHKVYEVILSETHRTGKIDIPSGTTRELEEWIREITSGLSEIEIDSCTSDEDVIRYDYSARCIESKHMAEAHPKGRVDFVKGALMMNELVLKEKMENNKTVKILSMRSLISFLLKKKIIEHYSDYNQKC